MQSSNFNYDNSMFNIPFCSHFILLPFFRSTAIGTFSMFSRIAGIIAPLILTLAKIWASLPLVIYGSFSVVAGLLPLFLPETLGQKLPETLEEGENLGL